MNTILYFSLMLVDTLAMLNVVLIIEVIFGAKLATNRKKLMIAGISFFIIEVIMETLLDSSYEVPIAFVEYALMFIITFIFATEKRIRTAMLTFSSVFVYLQWCYVGDLFEMLFRIDKYKKVVDGVVITPSYIISEITLITLLIFLRKTFKKKNFRMKLTALELVFVTIFCIFSPFLTEILAALESVVKFKTYRMMWVVFVLILNFAVIYAIMHRKKAAYYKELSNTYKQQFDNEHAYFKKYKDNNRSMINFRHDWNNHMIIMQELFEQGKYEEAKKYFESFPVAKKPKNKKLVTGNDTVDTIFAAKADLFEKYHIELTFNGNLSRLEGMEPVDICILFSNLIDNAIEALARVEQKRYFNIKVSESPKMLMIILKNNMEGELVKEGDIIKTSKKDVTNHGIGLKNIVDIITKYNGEYSIESQDGEFTIKIVFQV